MGHTECLSITNLDSNIFNKEIYSYSIQLGGVDYCAISAITVASKYSKYTLYIKNMFTNIVKNSIKNN